MERGMTMKQVVIQFDYLHGPLWKDNYDALTGEWSTGIPCIDNNEEIQELNDKAEELYESLYSFGGDGCCFDDRKYVEVKPQLLTMARKIIDILSDINDGTFVVIDKISETLS